MNHETKIRLKSANEKISKSLIYLEKVINEKIKNGSEISNLDSVSKEDNQILLDNLEKIKLSNQQTKEDSRKILDSLKLDIAKIKSIIKENE